MIKSLRAADLATGIFLAAFSTVMLLASIQIAGTAGERLHPRILPVIVSTMLLIGGLGLAIAGWRSRGEPKPIDWPDAFGKRRVLIVIASMVVYLALLDPMGFPLATLLFITWQTWYLGRYRWWANLLCGLTSALVVLFLFVDFLGLSFPIGPLELLF